MPAIVLELKKLYLIVNSCTHQNTKKFQPKAPSNTLIPIPIYGPLVIAKVKPEISIATVCINQYTKKGIINTLSFFSKNNEIDINRLGIRNKALTIIKVKIPNCSTESLKVIRLYAIEKTEIIAV